MAPIADDEPQASGSGPPSEGESGPVKDPPSREETGSAKEADAVEEAWLLRPARMEARDFAQESPEGLDLANERSEDDED